MSRTGQSGSIRWTALSGSQLATCSLRSLVVLTNPKSPSDTMATTCVASHTDLRQYVFLLVEVRLGRPDLLPAAVDLVDPGGDPHHAPGL